MRNEDVMRNADLMQINLLEYKLKKKKALMHFARMITACCIIALLTFMSYYTIYSKALKEKSKAEAVYEQLRIEHQHLVTKTKKYNDSEFMISQNLINQLNNESIKVVPQLNYVYTVAGTEIDIISITISEDEVSISANAENSERVKFYMDKINNSAYFGPLKEFKCENSLENNKVEFIIKIFRRP